MLTLTLSNMLKPSSLTDRHNQLYNSGDIINSISQLVRDMETQFRLSNYQREYCNFSVTSQFWIDVCISIHVWHTIYYMISCLLVCKRSAVRGLMTDPAAVLQVWSCPHISDNIAVEHHTWPVLSVTLATVITCVGATTLGLGTLATANIGDSVHWPGWIWYQVSWGSYLWSHSGWQQAVVIRILGFSITMHQELS